MSEAYEDIQVSDRTVRIGLLFGLLKDSGDYYELTPTGSSWLSEWLEKERTRLGLTEGTA